jgi:hypothetical protein
LFPWFSEAEMDLMDFGARNLPPALFTHAHIPEWKPAWGSLYPTLPVTFPTDKASGGEVVARLPLMADGLVHIDTDPEVTAIAAYPMTVEYMAPRRYNTAVKREHRADVAVLRADRSVVFIDYVPVNEQVRKPWLFTRTRVLRDFYAARYGSAYAVHDELSLYARPLFPNLKAMWAHKPTPLDPPGVKLVIRTLRRYRYPARIGALKRAVQADADLRAVRAELEHDGVDLAFTAIMQMCFGGELSIDLSRPFSDMTSVTARNLRGA